MLHQRHPWISTFAALLVVSGIAASIVMLDLGMPRAEINWLAHIGSVYALCLLGPLLFSWAWGPGDMHWIALSAAIGAPLAAGLIYYFGYLKTRALRWLLASTSLWGGFGGFTAWVAITGSI